MATLKYDFSVIGLGTVNRAMKSLERRLAVHNARVNRSMGRGGGAGGGRRGPSTRSVMQQQQRGLSRLDRTAMRMHGKRMRELGQEEQARIRTEHRIHRINRRNQLKRARENRRNAVAAERAAVVAGNRRRRSVGRGVRNAGRRVAGVGMAGASMLGIGAGFAMADSLGAEMALDKKIRLLAIQTRGAQQSRKASPTGLLKDEVMLGLGPRAAEIRKGVTGIAMNQGVSSQDLVGGLAKWQELTGRGDIGSKMAPMFADFSQVFGAGMEDVASVAAFTFAKVRKEVGEDGKRISTDEAISRTKFIMENIGAQGQQGMIEFASLAPVMGKITSAAASMGGDMTEILPEMVALAQIAIEGGASNAAESTTALMRFRSDMIKMTGRDSFTELNKSLPADKQIDPYTYNEKTGARTGLINPMALLKQVAIATEGDLPTMQKMMGERGQKIMQPIVEMMTKMGGGNITEGIKLAEKQMAGLSKAGLDPTAFQESKEFAKSGSAAQMTAMVEKIRNELGPEMVRAVEKMIPAIKKLAKHLPTIAEAVADAVEYFAENPWKGLAIAISASLMLEIGKVALMHGAGKAAGWAAKGLAARFAGQTAATALGTGGGTGLMAGIKAALVAAAPAIGVAIGVAAAGAVVLAAAGAVATTVERR